MGKLVFGIPVRRMSILLAVMAFSISAGLTQAKPPNSAPGRVTKVTQAERQAAADAAAAAGFSITAQALPQGYLAATPGDTPHYFSHPNYANSPLPVAATTPTPAFVGNPLDARAYDTDTAANVFVVLPTVLTAGELISFDTWVQATSVGNVFQAYVLRPTLNPDEYNVVYASGPLTVPTTPVNTAATFPVSPVVTVQDGDRLAFYGQGIPLDIGTGIDTVLYPAAPSPVLNGTLSLGTTFPILAQARTYSFGANVQAVTGLAGGIAKFVDGLPGLGEAAANNLGQYIPVAIPDTTTYPGSDYYEIGVVQYREQMHSNLPGTLLRGYVQLALTGIEINNDFNPKPNMDGDLVPTPSVFTNFYGVTKAHYLGPTIVATKDRPVRVLFRNLLPTGVDGNLFLPTDTTVMGAGKGPMAPMGEADPQKPECGMDDASGTDKPPYCYTENRATLHLHGGISPWISDGTPHQWTTPVGETTEYKDGVSVEYVPDMWFDSTSGAAIAECAGKTTCVDLNGSPIAGATNNPGAGAITFYWTNQQSARLMFYHDHAWGITRLNVLAGEAAAYLITDATEQKLVTDGLIPTEMIPLVLQDKTYVPSPEQLAVSDELWDEARWGGEGNLWLPHVYSPAQNPGDSSGVNQFGRWAYGPWFWPPTSNIDHPPVGNTWHDPDCVPTVDNWCEPVMMPGTPFNSMGMEAYHDTPIVNGTAYPVLEVQPKAYRLRLLNAASDRFFNLSLYKAVDANGVLCDIASNPNPVAESTGIACTEVALNPAEVAAALGDPAVFATPVTGNEGPEWIQIGTEGGFLPGPVVIPAQPITWVTDPTVFNAGNVDQHSLLIGPAERADTIVDFSAYAGQTLILYNDAPAAFPARDPRYDYYTGNPDLRDTGGAPSTLPGYGPNVRTVMQIKVAAGTGVPYNIDPLVKAFTHGGNVDADNNPIPSVFEEGQHPIIVGQAAYNAAYGESFGPAAGKPTSPDGFARITDFSMNFDTLSAVDMVNFPFQPKAIQDEMGEAFEKEYGRMSGNLGLEVPLTQAGVAQNLILYPYVNPASELINASLLPSTMIIDPDTGLPDSNYKVEPLSNPGDGTQIWKITHNGVDTHPIHFHLFDVQVVNRVGWDGIIRPPEANELGWKDTVRISPLEDTIVALRPIIPVVPFALPNSVRTLNPMMAEGSIVMFANVDAEGNPTDPIINTPVNFGWEYVWHCHILSHEEMDMMRPMSVGVPPSKPTGLSVTISGRNVTLNWTDASQTETGFIVQYAQAAAGPWMDQATLPANTTTYQYRKGNRDPSYFYRILASNTIGYNATPGYSTMNVTAASAIVNDTGTVVTPDAPSAPSNLTAIVQAGLAGPEVKLTWTDNSTTETAFIIERALGGGAFALVGQVAVTNPLTVGGQIFYTDNTVAVGNNYSYRVAATAGGQPSYSNTVSVSTALVPAAPAMANATASLSRNGRNATVTVTWGDVANETGYNIQIATDASFAAVVSNNSVGVDVTSYTSGKLATGTPYFVRVRAFNGSGTSAWTNAAPFPVTTP